MKPIVRWTLGSPTEEGFDILLYAIKYWEKLYPEFDRVVCYNESKPHHIKYLQSIGVNIFDQKKEYQENSNNYLWKPYLTGWKLCPPRLRLGSHEIFSDNDLILFKKCQTIDNFLESENIFFSCSAIKRGFGCFDFLVPEGLKLNSGLFGLPPNFDFSQHIGKMQLNTKKTAWENVFDDQGLVAAIFFNEVNHKIIPMDDIYNCVDDWKLKIGLHFCGVNSGNVKVWKSFKKYLISNL